MITPPITIAGGCESVSLVQNEHMNSHRVGDPLTIQNAPAIHMPMLDTAETVAKRYNISREAQDEYAVASQDRTANAQTCWLF
jgi:acetyl-CoA C-acetyltransferase